MAANPNRLLIIDDDTDLRDLVRTVAEDHGYAVTTADNEPAFWKAFEAERPTCIFLDLQMPGTDGVLYLRKLAAVGCSARIVVMSAAHAQILTAAWRFAASLGLRVAGPLEKPFAVDALARVLADAAADPASP